MIMQHREKRQRRREKGEEPGQWGGGMEGEDRLRNLLRHRSIARGDGWDNFAVTNGDVENVLHNLLTWGDCGFFGQVFRKAPWVRVR